MEEQFSPELLTELRARNQLRNQPVGISSRFEHLGLGGDFLDPCFMKIKIFAEEDLRSYLAAVAGHVQEEILSQSDGYLKGVSEPDFIKYIVEKFTIGTIAVDVPSVYATTYEANIPGNRFPPGAYFIDPREVYRRDVIVYHVPFTGPENLLRYRSLTRLMWSVEVVVLEGDICFELIRFSDDPSQIKREGDRTIQNINRQAQNLNAEIQAFNNTLAEFVKNELVKRRAHFAKRDEVLAGLGVPIKTRSSVPSTFAVPSPARRTAISVSKPAVVAKKSPPEPTLLEEAYQAVLKVIHDVGKGFERLPSTYAGKQEEDLRDHLLLFLEQNFEGTATGETFNKSGKTDILLKYETSNVFIAECKFWHGRKTYLSALSQLLSYLTWRDSKVALLVFVKNRGFSSVLGEVASSTREHPLFVKQEKQEDEAWGRYLFHLEGDADRQVKVSVMLFHFPGEGH